MHPGTRFADRFTIERHVTSGGMAAVYRALDGYEGSPVALKVLLDRGESRGEEDELDDRQRFEREARALADLRLPGIVRYVDHGSTGEGELWLAMEWLEGEDLGRRLAREPLSPLEAVRLVHDVAHTIAPAHARGVIHRDLKPSNLFLRDGELAKVCVLDFGVARLSAEARFATRSGALIGTPGYMAPEQARGDRTIDASADVFALGCVLFECLTGRAAFRGEHVMAVLAKILLEESPRLREHRSDLPEALDRVLSAMLAKDPVMRPRDGAEVAFALAELLESGTISAGSLPPFDSAPRPSITAGELSIVSVVVAGEAHGEGSQLAPTLSADNVSARAERLREAVAPFGARLEVLADGSFIACLGERLTKGAATATDRAAQAARCALTMREQLRFAPMVLVTGRAAIAGRLPVGDVIDRAARSLRALLLEGAEPAPVPVEEPPVSSTKQRRRPIAIDDVTAGLLDVRFDVGGARDARDSSDAGLELRGEREVVDRTRTVLGRVTPFIGRERELALLEATFQECVDEPIAHAVVVTAPAGRRQIAASSRGGSSSRGPRRRARSVDRSWRSASRGRSLRARRGRSPSKRRHARGRTVGGPSAQAPRTSGASPPRRRRRSHRGIPRRNHRHTLRREREPAAPRGAARRALDGRSGATRVRRVRRRRVRDETAPHRLRRSPLRRLRLGQAARRHAARAPGVGADGARLRTHRDARAFSAAFFRALVAAGAAGRAR